MRQLLLITIFAFLLTACGDDFSNNRCNYGEFVTTIEEEEGTLFFFEELNSFAIRYHIPGTIDSFYTGILCTDSGHDLDGKEWVRVLFTGDFYDDKGKIQPSTIIGGEEFFFLQVSLVEILE